MKKQILVRGFLTAALLVGFVAFAGDDVYAQNGGMIGSGTRAESPMLGSGGRSESPLFGSGAGTQVVGSGSFSDNGGMIGSGTATNGGTTNGGGTGAMEDDGGLIGSGTRSQVVGSGNRAQQSYFYAIMRYFGF